MFSHIPIWLQWNFPHATTITVTSWWAWWHLKSPVFQLFAKLFGFFFSGADQWKTLKPRISGLCERNPPVTSGSPHKEPAMRKMIPFDDVIITAMFCCGYTMECRGHRGDSPGIHSQCWSLSSMSPMNTWAVTLMTSPFQCIISAILRGFMRLINKDTGHIIAPRTVK